MSGIRGHLAKGAVWTLLARVSVSLVSLLSTFILARILMPADFGLVAIATTLLEVISAATNLSLASALIRHADPTEDHFHSAWTLNFIRATVIGTIFAVAAWPVAEGYDEPRLVAIMLMLAASVVMTGFANPKMVVFSRRLVFHQDFILQVSQKLVGFAVSVTLALLYGSYWALVLGVIASQATNIVVSYVLLPYTPRFRLRHWRELFSFSFWMTLQDFLHTLNWATDQLLIGALIGRTALGHFSVGSNLAGVPMREASMSISKLLFPGLSRVIHDPPRIRSAYISAQALLSAIILPVGFGLALCAHPVVLLAMGTKWLPIVPVIQGLSAISALQALGMLAKPLAMAQGVTRQLFVRNLASFAVCIPLSVTGLLLAGLNGVIIARIVAGLIAIGVDLYLVRQLIAIPIVRQITCNARSLASVTVMTLGIVACGPFLDMMELHLRIAAIVCLGASLYLSTHYLLWLGTGKGEGPELEILRMAERSFGLLRSHSSAR
jgi:O-antigen/teichoic acid export membrane protein